MYLGSQKFAWSIFKYWKVLVHLNLQLHCLKSVQTRSFFWSAFSFIHTEYWKLQTRKSFIFGFFHVVLSFDADEVKIFKIIVWLSRSSRTEVFLRKGVLKICSKLTGEHSCWSAISIKLQWDHTSAWVVSCKYAAYFQNNVS